MTTPTDDDRPELSPVNAPPLGQGMRLAPRSEAFQRFMAAPLIVATILMLATAVLAVLAWIGDTADGARVEVVLEGACAESTPPMLLARADEIGLGSPEVSVLSPTQVKVVADLPGRTDDENTHVPAVLARQGTLVAGSSSSPVFTRDQVDSAQVRLDESGMPYTWLDLDPPALDALKAATEADPEGEMSIRVDSRAAPSRPFSKPVSDGGIRLLPGEGDTRSRMRVAADDAIVLTHGPLACPLSVVSVTTVAPGVDGG